VFLYQSDYGFVDFPCLTVGNHAVKLGALFRPRAGDAIVRINASVFSFRVLLNVAAVIADLCRKGMAHPLSFH